MIIDKEKIKAEIRPYAAKDRDAVRKICCDTGFMGDPVDELFCDREIFADFFTSYYTDNEPENAMVAEVGGEVIGYIIGCLKHKTYPFKQAMIVIKKLPKVFWRIISGQYDKQTLKFIKWFITKANSETPDAPKHAAHFHVNLLNDYRQGRIGRQVVFGYLAFLQDKKVPLIYGQIQTYEQNKRSHKVFERYGAELYDRREITKFKDFGKTGVYVSTIVVDYRKKKFDEANRIIT